MKISKIKPSFLPLFVVLIPLAMGSPARADIVLGFPNGLTGWMTPDNNINYGDPGTVTSSGGLTTLAQSLFETDLSINFTIPTGAQSLQFTFNSAFPDSPPTSGVAPDAFNVALLDPTGTFSLVATVPPSDSFYARDITEGLPNEMYTGDVTLSPLAGTLGVISLNLASQGLDGQDVQLLFRLISGTDPLSASTVTVSDVLIVTGAAVPEPSSIISGLTACVGLAGAFGIRSRRRSRAAIA
jgi:hypothetical protein